MATLTRTVYPRAHSTVGDEWANLDNVYAADYIYAYGTAVYGEVRELWVYCEGASLPANAVVLSVTAETKYYVANPDANVRVRLQTRNGMTTVGLTTDTTNPITGKDIYVTLTGTYSADNVKSGTLGGMVRIDAQTNGKTSRVYFDYIRLVITYVIAHDKTVTTGVKTSATALPVSVNVYHKTVTTSVGISAAAGTSVLRPPKVLAIYPTGHATIGGTWSNPGNIYTDDGSYTTISPTRNDTGQILNVTFPSAALPAEAEIASVSAQIKWKSSRTNTTGSIQAGYDGVLRGTEGTDTATKTNTDQVFTNTDVGAWTVAELNSGLAYAAVRAFRSSYLTSTLSFDYACLIIEYTMPEEEEPQEYHKTVTAGSGVLAAVAEKAIGKPVRATTLLSAIANKGFLKTFVTGVAAAVTAAKVHLQDTVSHVKEAFTTVSVTSSAMRAFVKVVTTAVDGVSNIVKRTSKAATAAVHVGATAGRAIAKTVRAIVVVPAKAVKHVGKAAKTCVAVTPSVLRAFVKVVTAVANTASNVVKHSSKAVTAGAVHVSATVSKAIGKPVRALVAAPVRLVKRISSVVTARVAARSRAIFPFASLRYAAVSWEERETALEVGQGVVVLSVTEAVKELEVI